MSLKEITIEITQQCPNQCVHCSSLSCTYKTFSLSFEKITELVEDAVSLGCKSVNLSGGEPFVHPEIMQIVDFIYKQGLQCSIYTSGICFVGGQPDTVPSKILLALRGKVTKYIVNVESSDAETYDRIMGTSFNGFFLMKQFIHNAVAQGEVVEAHFVPMKPNYKQIPDVVNMCTEMGVSKVSFLRFVAQGRGLNNERDLLLGEEELNEARELMNECRAINAAGVRLGIPFLEREKRINCLTSISKLNIRYDGNVYPCEAFKNDQPDNRPHAPADNVETRHLIDIYQKSKYLIEIRSWLESFQQVDTCETCFAQYLMKL